MKETVRILILEAQKNDYDLAQDEISKSLKACTFEHAKTRREFVAALKTFEPDVILADYNLPRFNGMKTLELAREHTPLTPLVLWTEALSEDAAVECVQAGATAYILKKDVKRLGTEMIRAIRDRELLVKNQQSEDSLTTLKERFEALVIYGQDNISLLDKDGNLLWENPSATSTLGYEMDEFKGRNMFELIHPDDQELARELFAKLIQEPGRQWETVFRLKHSNGTWRWIEGTATNMLDNASVQAIVINYRDVTEFKETDARIRESEERFSKAFNLGPAALSISQSNGGTFLAVNDAFLELYGYEYAEVVGHTPQQLSMYPSEQDAALFMKLLHEQISFRDQEFNTLTKSGEVRTVVSSGEAIELGGEKYLLSFTTDITERRQAEEILQDSEKRFRSLFENSPTSLWEEDFSAVKNKFDLLQQEGVEDIGAYLKSNPEFVTECASLIKILDVNEATLKLFEAESKDDLTVPLGKIIRPESLNFLTDELVHLASGKSNFSWEGFNRTLKGRQIYVNLTLSVLPGYENKLSKVIVSIFDMTEYKQAQEKFKETSEQFRTLFEASPEAIMLVEPHGDWRILDCNSMACSMNGYTRDELIGQSVNIFNLTSGLPDERSDYLERIDKAGVLRYETIHKRKDGSVFPIEVSTTIIALGGREVILGIDRDITERKQAEEALHNSEERFRALFEDVPIAIWEEDFSEVKKHIDTLKQRGITDFRAYFASHPEEMIECKKMVRIVDVNKAALKMYQADNKEELIRIAMKDFSKGELENIIEDLVAVAEGKPSHEWEGADETLKGKPIEIALTRSVASGHEEDYSKVLVTTTDITERKQAEDALHESQIRYQRLFDNSPIHLWEEDYSQVKNYFDHLRSIGITDFQEYFDNNSAAVKECVELVQVLDVNRASMDFVGADDKSELLGSLSKSLNENAYPSFKAQLISLANGNTYYESDEVFTEKDGTKKYIFFSLSVSPEFKDSLSKVAVSIIDITDRKQAENALHEFEERFRLLFDRMLDGVYRSTHDGKFVDVNPAMVKMFGYSSRKELLAVDIKKELYFAPDERGSHILDTGQEETDIYRMRRKDGSEIWVEDHGSYVHDADGNVIYHEGILRDITERKRTEQELHESDERFRQLAENIDEVFWITDAVNDKEIYISPAANRIWGRSPDEMLKSTDVFIDSILAADRPRCSSNT